MNFDLLGGDKIGMVGTLGLNIMVIKILTFAFYILFFVTPLFFTPYNQELFEYNKMMLVYFLTSIIVIFWLIRMISEKRLIFKRTPLDIPIGLFLISQILSTIYSIDPHTSIFGYYSRSNGGLLSIISYILLYYALASNFLFQKMLRFLKAALWGGGLVALYALPEHFGVSPSCAILVHRWSADCWVQDVQARVFATLGQPNWLAAYLGMLIFPALYFYLQAKTLRIQIAYGLLLIAYYAAFTFTYSRGSFFGMIIGFGIFLAGIFISQFNFSSRKKEALMSKVFENLKDLPYKKQLLAIIGGFLIINLLFGSALSRFNLLSRSIVSQRSTSPSSAVTQLETGGTESWQIRQIVWKGAIDVFKHYPILGSGVETFAYSYYNYRPVEHNLVSEWDFLYNKAHNEYLNYLATTGLLGAFSYLLIILTFVGWGILKLLNLNWKLSHLKSPIDRDSKLFISAILGSYSLYLVQNYVGFSVVIIAVFFYIFPVFAFLKVDEFVDLKLPKKIQNVLVKILAATIYRKNIFKNTALIACFLILFFFLSSLAKLWLADTYFKNGSDYSDAGNPGEAYNNLQFATQLNPNEPLYRSELGFALADAAVAVINDDATASAKFKDQAIAQTELSLRMSPRNLTLWRTAIRTLYQLSAIDPQIEKQVLKTFDIASSLSPTDPKLDYNRALILAQSDKMDEAIGYLQKSIDLKPNYREAHFTLGVLYSQKSQKDEQRAADWKKKAIDQMEIVLKLVPNDPDAKKLIEQLKQS